MCSGTVLDTRIQQMWYLAPRGLESGVRVRDATINRPFDTVISYSEENNLNYGIIKEIIKFPQTKIIYDDNQKSLSIPINSDSKIKKITDYYRCSIKKNPSKNSIQKEIIRYNDDKKITDYFFYKKGKINDEQKKENEEKFKKIKSKSSSSSNKKKSTKKYKKSKNGVKKEILELLNLEA